MKIRVIAVAYKRPLQLQVLCNCFLVQTDSRWELNIIYDGTAPQDVCQVMGGYNDERIKFLASTKRSGCYGHPNRKRMLEALEGDEMDYVLLTNDDNYYVPTYVEMMLQQCSRTVGIVTCNTLHSHFAYKVHESKLKRGHIDMGAFIVKFPIAKAVGFQHTDFDADGMYAEECHALARANKLEVIHIDKAYFVHN